MRAHQNRRWFALLAVAAAAFMLISPFVGPAGAGIGPGGRDNKNRRIAVGDVTVVLGETVDGPLITIDGDAEIRGKVDGSAVVIRGDLLARRDATIDGDVFVAKGDARIYGTVRGDVIVLRGRAVIGADALVTGDVRSSDDPSVARAARVRGDVSDIDIAGILRSLGVGILVFWWIAVTVSTAILGVILISLFPRGLESTVGVGRARHGWWRAVLIGLAIVIGMPVVAFIAISTLVGLPLGLGVLGAMGLVHAIGYVIGAFFLGRAILRPPTSRFGAFFLGWGILRVLAVIPGLGVLVWVAAAVFGIGMLALAAVHAGRMPPSPSEASPASPTPELGSTDATPSSDEGATDATVV